MAGDVNRHDWESKSVMAMVKKLSAENLLRKKQNNKISQKVHGENATQILTRSIV